MELYTKKQFLTALPDNRCAKVSKHILANMKRLCICMLIVVYIGFILFGYGIIWAANATVKLTIPDETPLATAIPAEELNKIVHIYSIGVAVGPYTTRYITDSRGRKLSFFIGGCVIFFSYIIMILVNNLSMVFVGLAFMGMGTGIVYVGGIVYLGEMASANIRGTILTLSSLFTTVGMLVAFVAFLLLPYSITCGIGMLFSAIYLLALFYVPESPVFFAMKGTKEDIQNSLKALGRETELETMLLKKQELATTNKSVWSQLFTLKGNRRVVLITLILMMLQQAGGLVSTEFYSTTIYVFTDTPVRIEVITSINGATKVLAGMAAAFLVDKVGRRSLLMISTSSCALSLALLGTYFFIDFLNRPYKIGSFWIPVMVITNYFLSFELGFSILPQTLTGELFATKVRTTGATFVISIALLFGRGFAVFHRHVLRMSFGPFVQFWIFSIVCGVAFIFTIYLVPETNGKSLSEIEKMVTKDVISSGDEVTINSESVCDSRT